MVLDFKWECSQGKCFNTIRSEGGVQFGLLRQAAEIHVRGQMSRSQTSPPFGEMTGGTWTKAAGCFRVVSLDKVAPRPSGGELVQPADDGPRQVQVGQRLDRRARGNNPKAFRQRPPPTGARRERKRERAAKKKRSTSGLPGEDTTTGSPLSDVCLIWT